MNGRFGREVYIVLRQHIRDNNPLHLRQNENIIKLQKDMKVLKSILLFLVVSGLAVPSAHAIEFPPEPKKKLITHTVKKGEELHLLAGYYYLDCRQWVRIYQANMGNIINPNKLYPGQELYVFVDEDWEPPFDLDKYVEKWRPSLQSGTAP